MKRFNVTGLCIPGRHYMCDISNKVSQIAAMVERGDYFTINRARQYGKTTVIRQLEKILLGKDYQVARISFEGIGDTPFENEENFCQNIIDQISRAIDIANPEYAKTWINNSIKAYKELDIFLNEVCKDKKVVLIIDETDKSSNNLVFLRFIGMLRDKYLERGNSKRATFQSVILAGVYNIKNLKLKMIQAGTYQLQDGEKRINSPWNIATDFNVDMSFNEIEIASMLNDYENDHKTGMDMEAISKEIRAYTSGYPYLVSRICQKIEEELNRDWTIKGVQNAVKLILNEPNLLFDDLGKNMESNEELSNLLYDIVVNGQSYGYNVTNPAMELGFIFGFLRKQAECVAVDNLIFETIIYNHFITRKRIKGIRIDRVLPNEIIEDNKFDMPLCIEKFAQHYYELYGDSEKKFLENECRMLFLTYIKPLLNGAGFCHVESETRNAKRMDVIVDYNSEQFIVELKLWYGETSHEKALEQLAGYLDSKNKNTGYLLTFDFRKENNIGKPQAKWIEHKGKRIFDCMAGI